MRKKKIKCFTIILGLVIIISWILILRTRNRQNILIGAILPLTGSSAQYGQWSRNGAELAVEKINKNGGIRGRKIEILYEDSRSDAKEGVSALNSLYAIHKVQTLISESSGVVLAIAPVAEERKIVQLNVGAVNPQIRIAGDFTFSNINDSNVEAYQMAEYAYNKLNIRKLAILYATTSYGKGNRDAIKAKYLAIGGTIVADESFEENNGDYRSQLTKIKKSTPEAIYLVAVTKDAGIILRQAKELGLKAQFLSATFIEGKDLLDIAGNAANGVIYTSTLLDDSSTDVQEYISSYKNKYGQNPEIYSATAYDGIKIIALAIEKAGLDSSKIKEFLYSLKNYPGISGLTTFDRDGAVEKAVLFKTIKNGEFVNI
jgi:branched-chain amino acid transport system substrate-binding protein